MKKKTAITSLLCIAGIALGQGNLTPPGAPAPTMKTLQQVEPRTPLVAGSPGVTVLGGGGFWIHQSGSYYLTSNLTVSVDDGIYISVNGVTLDLMGFTISSTAATASGSGVSIHGSNISILNGHIVSGTTYDSGSAGDQYTGTGFQNGIYSLYSTYRDIRIRDCSVSGCDLRGIVINSSASSLVESCTVNTVGYIGIYADIIKNSIAAYCGGNAIKGMVVTDCRGASTGANGIYSYGSVANSYGYTSSSGSYGIYASGSVQNSYGYSEGNDGIHSGGIVANSYGQTTSTLTSAYGIYADKGVQNSYGASHGDDGIYTGGIVANSYGLTYSTSTSADGIYASKGVQNSYGYSEGDDGIHSEGIVANSYGHTISSTSNADGVFASRGVQNSYGYSLGDDGIESYGTVANSYGYSVGTNATAYGINSYIAIGCRMIGGQSISYKYNMP